MNTSHLEPTEIPMSPIPRMALAVLILAGTLGAADEAGSDPASPAGIHQLMVRIDDWQTAHPIQQPEHDCDWIRGTWYTGVTAAYKVTGDKRFLDQALAWGRAKGFGIGYEKSGSNRLFPADTWCELALITGDKTMIAKVVAELDTPRPNTPATTSVWYLEGGLRYADSLFGLPVLAKLATITGDRKYLVWMKAFFADVSQELWDPDDHLFFRDKRFIAKRTANGRKVVWSRGAGWVYSGLIRVLDVLPLDDPDRPAYITRFQQFSAAVLSLQGADGLWRPNMTDAGEFPMPETSGTAFFCSGLAWGVTHGVLDRQRYEPAARKAWAGLVANITAEGRIRFGQMVDAKPRAVLEDETHEYVTGAVLLAASAMYGLTGGKPATAGK